MTTHASGPCFCPQADFPDGGRPGLVDGNAQFSFSDLVAMTHKLSSHTYRKLARMLRLDS